MREIKFRAIIKGEPLGNAEGIVKRYFTLKELVDRPLFSLREIVIPWIIAGNHPDEYTGRKDNTGVEIYERDIVERHVNIAQDWDEDGGGYQKDERNPEWVPITGVVKFTHIGWRLDCRKPVQQPFPGDGTIIRQANLSYSNKNSRVIGNVEENPELLEPASPLSPLQTT